MAPGSAAKRALALQRSIGNRALGKVLESRRGCGRARSSPGVVLQRESALDIAAKRALPPPNLKLTPGPSSDPDPSTAKNPAVTFTPAPGPFEGAVSSDPYERQPAELRRVVTEDRWFELDVDDRGAVVSLYNRFSRFGLWRYADGIRRVKKGVQPWCGIELGGDTPTVYFTGDSARIKDALSDSRRFCMDPPMLNQMHAGQVSWRELSESDSLHISVGAKSHGTFDAHIDQYSPVTKPIGGMCSLELPAGLQHHLGEVALSTGAFRGYIGVPLRPDLLQALQARPGLRSDLPEMFEQNEHLSELLRPAYGASSLKGMGINMIRVGIEGRFSMGFLEGATPRGGNDRSTPRPLELDLLDLSRGAR